MHRYTCSKCHTPHNAALGRLLITNCLDSAHRGGVASGGRAVSAVVSGDEGSGRGVIPPAVEDVEKRGVTHISSEQLREDISVMIIQIQTVSLLTRSGTMYRLGGPSEAELEQEAVPVHLSAIKIHVNIPAVANGKTVVADRGIRIMQGLTGISLCFICLLLISGVDTAQALEDGTISEFLRVDITI